MEKEELEKMLLEAQDKLAKQIEENKILTSSLEDSKTELEKMNETITNVRDLNSQLVLRVSNQTLTPPKDEKEEEKEDKILSFDEINELL